MSAIFAHRSSEMIAIAADGLTVSKSRGKPDVHERGRKIHQVGQLLYAISGISKDEPRGYDPSAIIARAIAATGPNVSLKQIVAAIEVPLASALRDEILGMVAEDPAFVASLEAEQRGTSVIFAGMEDGEPRLHAACFRAEFNADVTFGIYLNELTSPGTQPPSALMHIGRHGGLDRYVAEHGPHFNLHPADLVYLMVKLEIDAGTPGVGPPIDVVTLDKNGITWISGESA